jgi:MerR family transcriptional regulator, light-induced transcriptional regulator
MTGSMSGSDRQDDNEMRGDGERFRESDRGAEAASLAGAVRRHAWADGDGHIAGLVRTIEGEIIPRLMLAHAVKPGQPAPGPAVNAPKLTDTHVAELVRATRSPDTTATLDHLQGLLAEGVSLEAVYLDLLTPAARELGRLWEDDLCTFTDVTIALWRLQEAMRELALAAGSPVRPVEAPHRVLLRQTPGEKHSFGINMVSEFFRRAGWDVRDEASEAGTDPVSNVRVEWFDVVGMSLSGERHLDVLATTIRAMRKASRNKSLGVMVGGPVFLEHPDWVARVGADATAGDARQAVMQAHNMIGLLARCN